MSHEAWKGVEGRGGRDPGQRPNQAVLVRPSTRGRACRNPCTEIGSSPGGGPAQNHHRRKEREKARGTDCECGSKTL
jgi:hypothetical protein